MFKDMPIQLIQGQNNLSESDDSVKFFILVKCINWRTHSAGAHEGKSPLSDYNKQEITCNRMGLGEHKNKQILPFFFFFLVAPVAYGGSQARGGITATVTVLEPLMLGRSAPPRTNFWKCTELPPSICATLRISNFFLPDQNSSTTSPYAHIRSKWGQWDWVACLRSLSTPHGECCSLCA